MSRILKTVSLAAFAAMLLGAMFASSASAATLTAGNTGPPVVHTKTPIHAVQYGTSPTENMFTAFGNKLSCENANTTFTGEASGTDHKLTITPTYKDCFKINENHSQGLPITVSTNGCHFVFNEPSAVGGSTTTFKGTVDVECPAEKVIEVSVFSGGTPTAHSGFRICRDTIGTQKGIASVEYHNVTTAGKPDDVTVTVRGTAIFATQHGLCGAATDEKAEYTSNLTLTSGTPIKAGSHDLWFSGS